MTAYTATVTVRLKGGVLDPEAETTARALDRLGFEVESLRSADRYELDLDAASADAAAERAEAMAERLLANPTIHDYEVTVERRASAATDGSGEPTDTNDSGATDDTQTTTSGGSEGTDATSGSAETAATEGDEQ